MNDIVNVYLTIIYCRTLRALTSVEGGTYVCLYLCGLSCVYHIAGYFEGVK